MTKPWTAPVLCCHPVLLVGTYRGGDENDDFLRLVSALIAAIRAP